MSGAVLEAEFITTDPDSSAYRANMTLYDQGILLLLSRATFSTPATLRKTIENS